MKVSELIKILEAAKEAEGNFSIKEWRISIPEGVLIYSHNSKKDKRISAYVSKKASDENILRARSLLKAFKTKLKKEGLLLEKPL